MQLMNFYASNPRIEGQEIRVGHPAYVDEHQLDANDAMLRGLVRDGYVDLLDEEGRPWKMPEPYVYDPMAPLIPEVVAPVVPTLPEPPTSLPMIEAPVLTPIKVLEVKVQEPTEPPPVAEPEPVEPEPVVAPPVVEPAPAETPPVAEPEPVEPEPVVEPPPAAEPAVVEPPAIEPPAVESDPAPAADPVEPIIPALTVVPDLEEAAPPKEEPVDFLRDVVMKRATQETKKSRRRS